ncbi:MAG: hypothetical protein NTX50_12845 [Candidatus Sumerlaeota bacterium]|nr:hypothetical protein [Candidatus Sumerlaeota bacterium]
MKKTAEETAAAVGTSARKGRGSTIFLISRKWYARPPKPARIAQRRALALRSDCEAIEGRGGRRAIVGAHDIPPILHQYQVVEAAVEGAPADHHRGGGPQPIRNRNMPP